MSDTQLRRYRRYSDWLREHFGRRVYKVSVDGGFTCPNRDGTAGWGGCTYCSNDSFRVQSAAGNRSIDRQIQEGIEYLSGRYRAERFLVYWQNFSGTYAPVEVLERRYREALSVDPRILGMSIGTRPDCVEKEKLDLIGELREGRYICFEYGLESIFDSTLRRINRGHDFACFRDAVERTKARNFDVCAHVILGFPGETRRDWLSYAEVLNELRVDFVKLHHLHVVRGTRLARQYRENPFPLFEVEEWSRFVVDFIERLSPEIVVQRLFGWAPEEELVAPRWGVSKGEILDSIRRRFESRDTWQGRALGVPSPVVEEPNLS